MIDRGVHAGRADGRGPAARPRQGGPGQGDLPTDAKEPTIKEINLAEFPIMQVSISGDVSPVQLKEIADDMQDAIETLPGVLKVDVPGGPGAGNPPGVRPRPPGHVQPDDPGDHAADPDGEREHLRRRPGDPGHEVQRPHARRVRRAGGGRSPAAHRARRQADLPGRRGHGAGHLQGSDHLLPPRTASTT